MKIDITVPQAQFLCVILQNIEDTTDNKSVARTSKNIRIKVENAWADWTKEHFPDGSPKME